MKIVNSFVEEQSNISILVKNTGWVYIGKIFTQMFALVTTVLVIRKLDVDVYGTYNFLLRVLIFFNVLSMSPVMSVLNRYIPEFLQRKDRGRYTRLIVSGILILFFSSAIIAVLLIVFRNDFFGFFRIPDFGEYQKALFIYIFLTVIKLSVQGVLTSSLLHKASSLLLILGSFFRSLLLVILLHKINVNILLGIESFIALCYLMPGIFIIIGQIRKISGEKVSDAQSGTFTRRILKYGLFSSLNELGAGIVGKSSDYFIISAMSNQYLLGMYAFANKIYEMIFRLLPYREFTTVLQPLFFKRFSGNDNLKDLILVYNFMVKMLFPVFTVPVLYFIVFGKAIIGLFFEKYIDAYLLCVLVQLSNTYWAFFAPVKLVIQLKEKMHISLISKIVVVFSIIAGIWAMKHYGLTGVALATLAGDFFKNLLALILIRRHVKVRYNFRELANYLWLFVFSAPFYFIQEYLTSVVTLLAGSVIYLGLIIVIIIRLNVFNQADREILDRMGNTNRMTKMVRKVILRIYNISFRPGPG